MGIMLLAIWLICVGAIQILQLSFAGIQVVMAILAIASGVLLLLGK